MLLDLSSLAASIDALAASLAAYEESSTLPGISSSMRDTLRAGVIQNFEVAYEMSWKSMRRWLEENYGSSFVDGITRRDLFRRSAENLLIADVDAWFGFHQSRNTTSHTFNAAVAADVFDTAGKFLPFAQKMFEQLDMRND